MEETILDFSVANMITVVIMAVLGFTILSVIGQFVRRGMNNAEPN